MYISGYLFCVQVNDKINSSVKNPIVTRLDAWEYARRDADGEVSDPATLQVLENVVRVRFQVYNFIDDLHYTLKQCFKSCHFFIRLPYHSVCQNMSLLTLEPMTCLLVQYHWNTRDE